MPTLTSAQLDEFEALYDTARAADQTAVGVWRPVYDAMDLVWGLSCQAPRHGADQASLTAPTRRIQARSHIRPAKLLKYLVSPVGIEPTTN